MNDKAKVLIIILCCVVSVLFFVVADWSELKTQTYQLNSDKLTSHVRIVLISDLHSTMYGTDQAELIGAINKAQPDVILLAGDLFDVYREHDGAKQLSNAIGKAYQCFYVTGNHEYSCIEFDEMLDYFRQCGFTVLDGDSRLIKVNGQRINICGISDPIAYLGASISPDESTFSWQSVLDRCIKQNREIDSYSILVTHRPERVESYAASGFDLIVAGHAHGGQARLPGLINGVYAPNQGLFPNYAGGMYMLTAQTSMVVSRALCRNVIPRIFNPPELVIIDID